MTTTIPIQPLPPARIARWRRALAARMPLLGLLRRRLALAALIRHREHPAVVPVLAAALESSAVHAAGRAREALAGLTSPSAIEALCAYAIEQPESSSARLCVEYGFRPEDDERACLFFFVTRQLDAYFDLDFEFQNLRLAFDVALVDESGALRDPSRVRTNRRHICLNAGNPTFIVADPPVVLDRDAHRFPCSFRVDAERRLRVTVRDEWTGRTVLDDHPVVRL